ncbi:fungal-specific transcription factor domain-containing protein [Tricladium varicosporioides]|nr:fungal-specific transcription factor domain-containing protein [Hymenoscyphus varicosporioides]
MHAISVFGTYRAMDMSSTGGLNKIQLDSLLQATPRKTRKWQFLNITDPEEAKQPCFKERVKKNATIEHRKYERMKSTLQYLEASKIPTDVQVHDPVPPIEVPSEELLEQQLFINELDKARNYRDKTSFLHDLEFEHRHKILDGGQPSNDELPNEYLVTKRTTVDAHHYLKPADTGYRDTDIGSIGTESPMSPLGAGTVDPFDTCPTNGDQSYYYLINHFILTVAPAFLPIDRGLDQNPVNRLWAWHSLTSPLLTHSILHISATRLDRFYHRSASPGTLYYRGETIRLLNEALSCWDDAISDSIIAAIAILVASENICEANEEILLHIQALQQLVSARGGISRLGWNRTLGMFISWQDLITSVSLNILPQFIYENTSILPLISQSNLQMQHEDFPMPTIFRDFKPPEHFRTTHRQIFKILCEIRYLTLVVAGFRKSRGATPEEMIWFSKARSTLEYRLILMTPSNDQSQDRWFYIYEVCRITALIYINYVVHEFDPAFGVLDKLKRRLIATVNDSESVMEAHTNKIQDLIILWSTVVGGLGTIGIDRKWFLTRILTQMTRLEITEWVLLESQLMKVLWIKGMRSPKYDPLWKDIHEQLNMRDFTQTDDANVADLRCFE